MNSFNDKIGGINSLEFVGDTDELLSTARKSEQAQSDSSKVKSINSKSGLSNENDDPQQSPEEIRLKREFEIYCQYKTSLIEQGLIKNETKEQFSQKKKEFLQKITSKKFLVFGEERENWDSGKYKRNIDKMFPDYHQILSQKIESSKSEINSKTESIISNLDTTLAKLIDLLQAVEDDQKGAETLKKEVIESLEKSEKSMDSAISVLNEWAKDEQSDYEKKYKDVISTFEQTVKNITANIEGIQTDKESIKQIIDHLKSQKESLFSMNQSAQSTTDVLQLVEIESNELKRLSENITESNTEAESVSRSTEPVSIDDIKKETKSSTNTIEEYDDEVELLEFEKKGDKGIYGKSIDDQNTYYISDDKALIRDNSNPKKASNEKIPQGVQVKRLKYHRFDKSSEVWQVEIIETNKNTGVSKGEKFWTSASNTTVSKSISDSDTFISFYDDVESVEIYESPYGQKEKETKDGKETTKTKNIEDTEFKITEQCGSFVKIKQGDDTIGWIKKAYLVSKEKQDNLNEYQEWLYARYTEISGLKDNSEKVSRSEGILAQVEEISQKINEKEEYPDITSLDKKPKFDDQENLNTFVPPGLIAQVRKFIELIEKDKTDSTTEEAEVEACEEVIEETTDTDNETEEITVTPNIDWNSRLGVQQYRSQSDNLTPPEVTCGVTAFSMAAERVGYSREDVLAAIDRKIKKDAGGDLSDEEFQEKWEEKATAFLKSFKSKKGNFRRLRGGTKGGVQGEESDLSESLREWGQYEDLLYFLGYVNNIASDVITMEHNSKTITEQLEDDEQLDVVERTDLDSNPEFDMDMRNKIKTTLENGGGVIMSIYHKGKKGGTHIVNVRNITSKGLEFDDPYGQINPEYIRKMNLDQDAYIDTGKGSVPSHRSKYDWKNVPEYKKDEDNYTERDFTKTAAENLKDNEKSGSKSFMSWEMVKDSTSEIINYVLFIYRN